MTEQPENPMKGAERANQMPDSIPPTPNQTSVAAQALAWVNSHWMQSGTLAALAASAGWISDWSYRAFLGLPDSLPKLGGIKDYFVSTSGVIIDTFGAVAPMLLSTAAVALFIFTMRNHPSVERAGNLLVGAIRKRALLWATLLVLLKIAFLDFPFLASNGILSQKISAELPFSVAPVLSGVQSTAWTVFVCAHFPDSPYPERQTVLYQSNFARCAGKAKNMTVVLRAAYSLDFAITALVACLLFLPQFRPPAESGTQVTENLFRLLLILAASGTLVAQSARTIRTFQLPLGTLKQEVSSETSGKPESVDLSAIELVDGDDKIWLYDRRNKELLNPLQGDKRKQFSRQNPPATEDVVSLHQFK